MLHTHNPVALQALMSETLFSLGETVEHAESVSAHIEPISQTSGEEFIYQGDKSNGVLFILRYADYPYFSPQAEDAFVKTIGALQLSLQNVAIVNLANPHNPNDFKQIMSFFQPRKITLLGVEPASLKLPHIAHNAYMKGRVATVFHTFSFEEMFADTAKKRAFWMEFKTFIGS